MIGALLQRMGNSAYVSRLGKTFPIFAFILLLQALLGMHLLRCLSITPANLTLFMHYFGVESFRSLLWASITWGLVAWPRTKGWQCLVTVIAILFFGILHLFESYLLGKYGEGCTFSIVTILMATTEAESKEYLATSLSFLDFARGLSEITVSLLITFWIPRWLCRRWTIVRCKKQLPLLLLLTGALDLCNLVVFMPRLYFHAVRDGIPVDATLSPVDRLIWNTGLVYAETSKIQARMNEIVNMDLGQLQVEHPYGPINVVVVIGETLRRDYMHCYGYPLETTPKLDSLIADGSMVIYSDVISPATATVESLTRVLTYFATDLPGYWYDYPTLTNVLSRSGYDTYWLSNQDITGAYVQPVNVIARMADHLRYVKMRIAGSDARPIDPAGYDMEVLPYLNRLDARHKKSVVQFIHLIGSHVDYAKRYPKSYARFSARDINAPGDKNVIAEYVNSVYYNDDVVANIVKCYEDDNTLLFYFSDHGEAMYDAPGKPGVTGHGLPLRSNVEVPFMVYVSPKLRRKFPELYERIVLCKDRPIMNDLFTNSLLSLLGVKSKYSNEKLEYFSDGYDATRQRRPINMNRSFSYEK